MKISDFLIKTSNIYIKDSKLYRPLFKAVLPVIHGNNPSVQLAVSNVVESLQQAITFGEIDNTIDVQLLAEQLETFWMGTLVIWTGGSIDGNGWTTRLDHGIGLMLQGVVTPNKQIENRKRTNSAAKRIKPISR